MVNWVVEQPASEVQNAVAVPSRRLRPGTTLGRYKVLRHLASGGMAELYLARAKGIEGFEKTVVLKQILAEFSHNDRFVQMFLDEARLAAMLHHPNIVQVFDIASSDDGYFFTMEWIHGHDARRIQKRAIELGRPLPLECALAIVIGAASGLHHAHEMRDDRGRWLGIVHRDVSPSNILVTFDGGVKVADFGIAKAATQQSAETRTGTLKGKISYMSPEQCRTETLDRRSDVFALGIVLHELTTGRRLYTGDGDFQIMESIVHRDATRPSSIIPDYPPALEQIVMTALSRNRDTRTPTAAALQRDLEKFAREEKLAVSSLELASLMRELFGEETFTPPPDSPAHALEPESATRPTKRDSDPLLVTSAERPSSRPAVDIEPRPTAIGTSERTRPVPAKRRTSVWIATATALGVATTAGLLIARPGAESSPSTVSPAEERTTEQPEQPTVTPTAPMPAPVPASTPPPPPPASTLSPEVKPPKQPAIKVRDRGVKKDATAASSPAAPRPAPTEVAPPAETRSEPKPELKPVKPSIDELDAPAP